MLDRDTSPPEGDTPTAPPPVAVTDPSSEDLARRALLDRLTTEYPADFLDRHLYPIAAEVRARTGRFAHSPDFRTCSWAGREYAFNASEAAIVRALFEDFVRGGPGLARRELLAAAGLRRDEERVDHVFRHEAAGRCVMHPAWRDGLIRCVGRGRYRLGLSESPNLTRAPAGAAG